MIDTLKIDECLFLCPNMIFLVVAVTLPSKLAIFPLFFIRDHRKRTKPARGHTISLRPRNILTSPTLDSIERVCFYSMQNGRHGRDENRNLCAVFLSSARASLHFSRVLKNSLVLI